MLIRELQQLTINAQYTANSRRITSAFCSNILPYMDTGGYAYWGYSLHKYAITLPKLTHERNDNFKKITYISVHSCA